MKNKMILNIMIIIIAIMLFAMPGKVFAEPGDLRDVFGEGTELEDQTEDLDKDEQGQQTPPEQTEDSEDQYSDAGLAEDTIMVVSIVALISIAAISYKKVKEYQNI